MYILPEFKMMFWNFELLRKLEKNRLPNDAFCLNLKRCKMRRFIIVEFSGPDVIFKRLFRLVYTILYFENGIPYIPEHVNQVQCCICSNNYINRDKTTYLYS